uniref:ABC-type antigen peptide transporter n=1 Tax=Syphacia muris TaxID=451379 RepID=A0A0N5AN58_9BILA
MVCNLFSAFMSATVFGCLDVLVNCICVYFHSPEPNFQHFIEQFQFYSFQLSTIEFIGLSLIRFGLLLLPPIYLFTHTHPQDFIQKTYHLVFCFSLLLLAYSPTKLLALSESNSVIPAGDYVIISWNFIASVILCKFWTSVFAKVNGHYETLEEESVGENNSPSENLKPKETFELIFRLLQYCGKEWLWHLSGFTWLFIFSITRVFVPYYTGDVVARVVRAKDKHPTDYNYSYDVLITSIKTMTIISVASAISGGLRGGSFEYAYARISRAIRRDLFDSLVKQDVAFYDGHKTGEITSRLTADCQTMSDTVAMNVNVFLRNTVMVGGSMIFMMVLSWRLSLVTFIVVPIIFVASKIFGTYYDMLTERTQAKVADANDVAEEVLSTMRTVRSFACETDEADRYYMKLTDILRITKLKAVAYIGFLWVNELFQAIIIIAVLWYGGHLVLMHKLKADLLVSFLLYQLQLGENLRQIGEVWTGLMQSVGASRKVFDYIDRKPDLTTDGTYINEEMRGHVEFRNVNFSYPTRPNITVLKNLSFTVEPGETVALVGPSGGGKSSCIALLEHFYNLNGGEVLIDGVPVEDFDHGFIHKKIALVGQEPVLFARSISENIAYGLSQVNQQDIIHSAQMANAHDFIVDNAEGYSRNVGEQGSQMSGGQKQRIAIARALVRQPVILLLDEATSALDTESEALVQEAIYKNLKGKSVILIAHRLSTVEKADKIVVINKGQVEQQGTHEELLRQPGLYKTLVNRQLLVTESDAKDDNKTKVQGQRIHRSSSSLRNCRHHFLSSSPRSQSMARSLLATSFTPSTSSLQSR